MLSVEQITHALSASIAPVFLISGVGVLISCMAVRYGRVIDRTRTLLRDGDRLYNTAKSMDHLNIELKSLYKRAKNLRATLILSAGSIFFVVCTVLSIFATLIFKISFGYFAEGSFILSLLLLIAALGMFIKDFMISLKLIKRDIHARADIDVLQDQ